MTRTLERPVSVDAVVLTAGDVVRTFIDICEKS